MPAAAPGTETAAYQSAQGQFTFATTPNPGTAAPPQAGTPFAAAAAATGTASTPGAMAPALAGLPATTADASSLPATETTETATSPATGRFEGALSTAQTPNGGAGAEERGEADTEAADAAPVRAASRRNGASALRFDESLAETSSVAAGGHVLQAQGTGATATHELKASVAEQVGRGAATAAAQPGQSVHVELRPDGLGSVSLRVTVSEAGVRIHITTDNPSTRDLLQSSTPQLQQALDRQSLNVDSLVVGYAGGQAGGMGAGQQGSAGHNWAPTSRAAAAVEARAATDETNAGTTIAAPAGRVDYRV